MEPLLELRWMEQVRTQSEWIIGEAFRGPLKLLTKTFTLIRNGSACLSTCEACGLPTVCVGEVCILSVSLKECNARVEISETFLSLIKFIENSNPSIPKNLAFCDLKNVLKFLMLWVLDMHFLCIHATHFNWKLNHDIPPFKEISGNKTCMGESFLFFTNLFEKY